MSWSKLRQLASCARRAQSREERCETRAKAKVIGRYSQNTGGIGSLRRDVAAKPRRFDEGSPQRNLRRGSG